MRIAMVTPSSYPSFRGNSVTVERIASGLRERGHSVAIYSLEAFQDRREIPSAIWAFGPDLVHGFHAFASGGLVAAAARGGGVPALVTITGTDVNHDLFHPERRGKVVEVLKLAQGIVAFHESIQEKLLKDIPELHGKIRVIRQTVACEEKPDDYRARWGLGPRHVIFLLPAGIRRVKNLPFCLPPLSRLQSRYPDLCVLYAGPVLEEKEGRRLLRLLAGKGWARYLGEVPHEEICSMLRVVDVVVNSSLSEGGMSNALLEAMSRGVAVLASDIEGNRSIILDEVDGLLFASEEDFEQKAERLILDPDFRWHLGRQAKAKIEREFSREREIDAYEHFYRDLLEATVKGEG
ncbi:MAG: glycosyltransferase [Candidatus Methylomirabilales bacterium]